MNKKEHTLGSGKQCQRARRPETYPTLVMVKVRHGCPAGEATSTKSQPLRGEEEVKFLCEVKEESKALQCSTTRFATMNIT